MTKKKKKPLKAEKKKFALPERDPSLTLEEWEEAIFKNYDHFTTFRWGGRFKRDSRIFQTFPDALADAKKGVRVMLYIVAKSGRFVALDESKWPKFLQIWMEMKKDRNKKG